MPAQQWLLLVALSILWGGAFFFVGIAVKDLPPLTIVLARVGLAAAVLTPIVLAFGHRLPNGIKGWMPFAIMSLLNNVIPFTLITTGQRTLASGVASIINATTPLFTLLIAHAFTSDEKLKSNKLAGVLVSIAGVAVLVGPEALIGSSSTFAGMLLCLGGALAYGFAALWGRRLRATPPLVAASCQLIASTVILAPLAALAEMPWLLPVPSAATLLALAGLAVLSTALAYAIFFQILTQSGPTNVMLVTLLIPVSGIALGVLVLGETLLARHVAGALVIGTGLLVIDGRVLGSGPRP